MESTQEIFDRIVSNDYKFEDIKSVTLAIWHENFIPEVNHLSRPSAQIAGYLIDKLRRYNCVSLENKIQLRKLVVELKIKFNIVFIENKKYEQLANDWNLDFDLRKEIKQLLYYQKRHYKHL